MVLPNSTANVQMVTTFHFVLYISAMRGDQESASYFRVDEGDRKSPHNVCIYRGQHPNRPPSCLFCILPLSEGRAGIALEMPEENRAG